MTLNLPAKVLVNKHIGKCKMCSVITLIRSIWKAGYGTGWADGGQQWEVRGNLTNKLTLAVRLEKNGSLSWGNQCQQIRVNSTETLEAEIAWIASRASIERVAGSTPENRKRVHFIESGVNLCAHFCLFSEWAVLGCDIIWKHLWRLTLATVLRVEHQEQEGSRNAT